jgi:hypothetical protein
MNDEFSDDEVMVPVEKTLAMLEEILTDEEIERHIREEQDRLYETGVLREGDAPEPAILRMLSEWGDQLFGPGMSARYQRRYELFYEKR